MTKAEMAGHRGEYYALITQARAALQERLWQKAIEFSKASWTYIDGMMQYERKYEKKEFASIEGIDIVLRFAPFLFDLGSLDDLATLLKSQRRIDKNASADIADSLSKARSLMWQAHRLWSYLDKNSEARQDELRKTLGGDQDRWRSIAESWEKLGVIRRISERGSYRLTLFTRMDAHVLGKCPSCGAVVKARKFKLLGEAQCPKCAAKARFVILAREIDA